MDFAWTREHEELYGRILQFSREALNDDLEAREREHRFAAREWRRCGDFGLLGLSLPDTHGGMGLGALATARAVEAFGKGCRDGGLVFSAMAHLFACAMPIAEHGDEPLRRRLLPELAAGRLIGANAITEAEAGSDAFALRTRAVRDGDDYLVTGAKTFVSNGPVADVFVVYATVEPSHGFMGVTALAVEKGTAGLVVGRPFDKGGLTTSPISSLYLEDCRVPAACRLGAEGQGAAVFESSMRWERACLLAAYVGSMERQLEQAVAHARERRQFGRPIGKNQSVSNRIVDMRLRLESARLLLYRACWLKDEGQDASRDISLAKLAISEAAVASSLDAIQIHGGQGVMAELGLMRALVDAVPSTIFSGTSEMQREIIARREGL